MINKQCHKEDQVIKKTREYSNNDEVQLLYNRELRTKALRDQLEKHGLRLRTRTDEPYHIYITQLRLIEKKEPTTSTGSPHSTTAQTHLTVPILHIG